MSEMSDSLITRRRNVVCHLLHWPLWMWVTDDKPGDDLVNLLWCPKCSSILRVEANT